ncbi:MAG: hypothetical protein PHS02_02335 [Candidatus ainarchaeum sp.]|nr:hypothetical protein [Candidatus ainarchaeum sp.]
MTASSENNPGKRMRACRAQGTVEFLVMIVAALLLLSIIYVIAGREITEIQKSKQSGDARIASSTLASAAKEVYYQGQGARKQVYVYFPPEYEPSSSYIANRTVYLSVGASSYAESLDFDVHGSLPFTAGGNFVWIISEGSSVRIGSTYLFVRRSSLPVSMGQSATASQDFYVKNVGNDTINITVAKSWPYSDVTVSVSASNFTLIPDQMQPITVEYSSNGAAYGLYGGTLLTTASTPFGTEDYTTMLSADVSAPPTPPTNVSEKNLTIIPHLWQETLGPGNSTSKTFTVCSGQNSSFSSVSFAASSGAPGSWMGNTSSIGPLPQDSCAFKTFELSVPANATNGIYSGSILASGDGIANDSVSLIITVASQDNYPPRITDVIHAPNPARRNDSIRINATANDSGNPAVSNISMCIISIDNSSWSQMVPADGSYSSPEELVTHTISGSTLSPGNHLATIRCNDTQTNLGEANYTFHVKSSAPIVFITNQTTANAEELAWMTFLNTSASQMGFSWAYDAVPAANATASPSSPGYVNISGYTSALLAEYATGIGLGSVLTSFTGQGGSVLMVGAALAGGVEVGDASSAPNVTLTQRYWIYNSTHYITSGYSGSTKIWDGSQGRQYSFPVGAYLGTGYVDGMDGNTRLANRTALGKRGKILMWGMTRERGYNADGTVMSTRTIDYTLNLSTVSP